MELDLELVKALAENRVVVEDTSVNCGFGDSNRVSFPRFTSSIYDALSHDQAFQLVELAKVGARAWLEVNSKTD